MRAREFIRESEGDLKGSAAEALPTTAVLPQLKNQDAYMQYRASVAMAAARAVKNGDVNFDTESAFNQNMVVVARSEEEEQQLKMMLDLIPGHNEIKVISTKKSEELSDTNTASPVAPKPLIKRGS